MKDLKQLALEYHANGRPGKLEVVPTKPSSTQLDLTLAYSPGVAAPCLEIEKNPSNIYKYTGKGNLVAVISNGTAVLGLGDIGAAASKPVMEGKGFLFKIFGDIDVFDIEIDEKYPDKIVEIIQSIAGTFGGINLEDIKAPECFEIENRLKEILDIPIMHDDQHGTAIITGAGLLNAAEIAGKKLSDIKLVVNGAGASAIACSKMYINLGINPENIVMLDSKGVINKKRSDINKYKAQFATERNITTLEEAIEGADMFLGLSRADILLPQYVEKMNNKPIIFALANPNPEITPEKAYKVREDIIMATGRSDYPNQVNNVLGFPYIFRGALDVQANCINEEMKMAAAKALALLAKQPVPQEVLKAYNLSELNFGTNYIIPTPFDPRLKEYVAFAVAKAAVDSGVSRITEMNWDEYKSSLEKSRKFTCK